jgi:hypothetical protein
MRHAALLLFPGDGRFVDPTDSRGVPSNFPGPGAPWPFPVDGLPLAYANEPPKGAEGTNCFVETGTFDSMLVVHHQAHYDISASLLFQTGSRGPEETLFVANRDIQPSEEIYIDYGLSYDRSSYAKSK